MFYNVLSCICTIRVKNYIAFIMGLILLLDFLKPGIFQYSQLLLLQTLDIFKRLGNAF